MPSEVRLAGFFQVLTDKNTSLVLGDLHIKCTFNLIKDSGDKWGTGSKKGC